MMYKINEKANNQQQQITYVLYMMIGSYFHKSICSNRVLETKLLLHYRDLPAKRQEELEEKVIANIEKELKEILPVLSGMNCKVFIRKQEGDYRMTFETGFEEVTAVVDSKGKYRIQVLEES